MIDEFFQTLPLRHLATSLKSRDDDASVEVTDAAYWMKGCSSLGLLRFAVLLTIGSGKKRDLALMDVKEAVTAAAPRYPEQKMPKDQAERVVEGAMHLSPHLGKRMVAGKIEGKSVFIRELLPQDLKIELEQLSVPDAMKAGQDFALASLARPMRARWTWRRADPGPANWVAIDPIAGCAKLALVERGRAGWGSVYIGCMKHCRKYADKRAVLNSPTEASR